jgi:hypothetical protein
MRLEMRLLCPGGTQPQPTRGASCLVRVGAPSRTRTCDLLLRRQPLYPLSYRGSPARQGRRRQAYRLAAAGPSLRGGYDQGARRAAAES